MVSKSKVAAVVIRPDDVLMVNLLPVLPVPMAYVIVAPVSASVQVTVATDIAEGRMTLKYYICVLKSGHSKKYTGLCISHIG